MIAMLKMALVGMLMASGCASNNGGVEDDAPIGFILLPPQAFSGDPSGFSASLPLVEGTAIRGASISVTCGSSSYAIACAKIGSGRWCSPAISCSGHASLTVSMPRIVVGAGQDVRISVTGGPTPLGVDAAVVTYDAVDPL